MSSPPVDHLDSVIDTLRGWQADGAPIQLHPGDLGWFQQFGADALAAAVRTWSVDGRILAIGLFDGPSVLRLAVDPHAQHDDVLAERLVADLAEWNVPVEARAAPVLCERLSTRGWQPDEPWTPLVRDLTEPVPACGLRVATIGPELSEVRVAVHRASFERSRFSEQAWREVAAGTAYADAECLVAYDSTDTPVAAATVWSAGPGRPGLLEPLGVHRDHRGRGHGRAISLAAAAALRRRGSSSALVCTPAENVGAVATYRAAGFRQLPDVRDLRPGPETPATTTAPDPSGPEPSA